MSAKLFLKNNVLWVPSLYMQKQHTEVFYKRDVLKSFMKFTGIQLRQSLSLIKLQAFNCKPKTLLKKRLQRSCFPVKSNYFVDYLWMAASVLAVTLANITLRETFFALLKHECTRKAWTAAITWKKENLSKKVFFCSNHFEELCFDKNWVSQKELFYTLHYNKRGLIDELILTIFSQKQKPKKW